MGSLTLSSTIGRREGVPYTAQLEENTIFFTERSRRQSTSLRAASILLAKYFLGFATDSPTYEEAAKCMTTSTPSRQPLSFSLSAMSPTTSWKPSDRAIWPVLRLS